MLTLKRLAIGLLSSVLWPLYVGLLAVIARGGPWPRGVGRPLGFVLGVTAGAFLISALLRWIFRGGGWLEQSFAVPDDVLRQLRRTKVALWVAATGLILPEEMLARGMITSSGRPIVATTLGDLLIIAFEVVVWIGLARLLRPWGPLGKWLSATPEALGWCARHRRAIRVLLLAAVTGVIALEANGYGFTARRLALAGLQSIVLVALGWGAHRVAVSLIAQNAWSWVRNASNRVRTTPTTGIGTGTGGAPASPSDIPRRVRRLADWGVPILVGLVGLYIWDVDLALFRYVGEQHVWKLGEASAITVTDLATAVSLFLITGFAWRHLSSIFTLVVYPRMPEDPGIRFAVLTLCRYVILAIGSLAGLSSLHLGLDKIGVVLAALGVGLGFGLQEIVSNFVSGIILLLERPIRVGDVVTVASMTGKIDRINIRATTLINSDNQSLIIPNREFITGNLINWTLKDKVIRFSIHLNVALGTDPDEVVALLMTIARADTEVLGNPVPCAFLESFGPASLSFGLHVHVPDPSVSGRVKHRLCTQIQKKFAAAGIEIPVPTQELRVERSFLQDAALGAVRSLGVRVDPPEPAATPPPMGVGTTTRVGTVRG